MIGIPIFKDRSCALALEIGAFWLARLERHGMCWRADSSLVVCTKLPSKVRFDPTLAWVGLQKSNLIIL
jgi:hypothetical protein